jgi:hypothetical protein
MPVPYTSFGTATSAIPLSELDANFAAPITIGNTAVQLGNTVTTLNNMTLANVTISSGNVTITNVGITNANVSGTANISTLVVVGNATVGGNTTITGNITAANANVTTNLVLSNGTANGVAYLNVAKVLTTGSALTYNGTTLVATATTGATVTYPAYFDNSGGGVGTGSRIGFRNTGASYGEIGYVYDGAFATIIDSAGSSNTRFLIGGTEGMRLTSTSLYTASAINVGIGLSNPTAKLQVFKGASGAGAIADSALALQYDATTTYGRHFMDGNGFYQIYAPSGGVSGGNLSLWATNSIQFRTAGTLADPVKMTLDASGNLLVGQTSKSQTTVGFYAAENGEVSGCLAASTNAATQWNTYSTGAGAYRFYVGMGGTIFATSIVITAISDQRLKENIRDIDTGLSAIMALKPRRFDWKEGKGQDKKNAAGFIAQEFEDVFPECVSTSMAGADGIEYKNINHETLIPTLVKAIQEQQALITQLTARITALEGA